MKPTKSIEIRKYYAANWWSVSGVSKKMKMIMRKGVPDLTDWRFITLTLDPSKFESELAGYLKGKDEMRRFLARLRKHLGIEETGLAWKLEFQKNGWAHWHIFLDYKKLIPKRELDVLWGLGITDVRRCQNDAIFYAFKYALKPALRAKKSFAEVESDNTSIGLPDWFLDHYQPSVDGSKPKSLSNVRFWQAKNFYTGKPAEASKAKKIYSSKLPRPMRSVAMEGINKIQLIARKSSGAYAKSAVVIASVSAASIFSDAGCLSVSGAAAPTFNQGYLVPRDFLEPKLKNINKVKLCQLQQLNKTTIRQQIKAILKIQAMTTGYCSAA